MDVIKRGTYCPMFLIMDICLGVYDISFLPQFEIKRKHQAGYVILQHDMHAVLRANHLIVLLLLSLSCPNERIIADSSQRAFLVLEGAGEGCVWEPDPLRVMLFDSIVYVFESGRVLCRQDRRSGWISAWVV